MLHKTIVCRCEDLSLEEIRDLIAKGYKSIDELKRISRCSMGPCQGRGCRQIVAQEVANATGKNVADIEMPKFRPPVKPIKLGALLGGDDDA